LCDAPQPRGGSWGDDGNIIAALRLTEGLSQVPASGGTVKPATELKQENKQVRHRWPQLLPGAQMVLFTASTVAGTYEFATIEAQKLRTGERKTLVRGGYYGRYVPSGHLLYVLQGTLYAAPMNVERLELIGPAVPIVDDVASRSDGGFAPLDFSGTGTLVYLRRKAATQTIVWLGNAGGMQPLRAAAAEYSGMPRFSPDSKRLALTVVDDSNADVWLYEWERGTMTRLTFTPGYDGNPVWSPDGRHIVFTSARHGGAGNLYWMRADGAGEVVRLTESENLQEPFSFSPDGKRLVYHEWSPLSNGGLWTLSVTHVESDRPDAGKPEHFLQTPFWDTTPMISPDGQWLAYESNESGRDEVYVRRFPAPGGKLLISTDGGNSPVWSRKGRELYYRSGEGMMAVRYTMSGEAFLAAKPRVLAEKKDLGFFDLAPDGKGFAVVQPEASQGKGPAQVTFLLNFFDELRRRAPVGK
jgi:Tol biopolymer transport system component